jgi:hypothetical protein
MDSEIGVPGKGNAEITRRAPNGALKMGVSNCIRNAFHKIYQSGTTLSDLFDHSAKVVPSS